MNTWVVLVTYERSVSLYASAAMNEEQAIKAVLTNNKIVDARSINAYRLENKQAYQFITSIATG